MADTDPVTLELDPKTAAAARIEARRAGLTDADIDAELDAYNAERRIAPAA